MAAYQRFVRCAADHGVTVTLEDMYGIYQFSTVKSNTADEAISACQVKVETISALYVDVTTNPQNLDPNDVRAACLRKLGVVPPNYTGKQFAADMSARTQPFDPGDSKVARCMVNPQAPG